MAGPDASSSLKSDFLAAEEIKGILHGRERAEQERIIRWVSESLALRVPAASTPAEVTPRSAAQGADLSEERSPTALPQSQRPTDIRSFVQEKQPKSDVQFVAVTAYYWRFMASPSERKETITAEDLQTGARHSQRVVFKAPGVTLNNAVTQGYMDRATRGEYRLNAVGENLVAMTLPGLSSGANGTKPAKRRRRAQNKATAKKKSRA